MEFEEYHAQKIVNVHKHIDSMFWDKYSASPYRGCRSGCEFCYLRGGIYDSDLNPETFNTFIRVKSNAKELLQKELAKLSPDIINCGDWQQPAEDKFRLSRDMLKVVHESGFPLLIIERSPLVTRDLDLLIEINKKAWVGVVFSVSSLDSKLKQVLEPRSPGPKRRLQAMEQLAQAGIQVGTALMPIFPLIGDDKAHLEEVIQATKDHGGSFIIPGGMTMSGVQSQRTRDGIHKILPSSERLLNQIYNSGEGSKAGYSPNRAYIINILVLVRELCEKYGLRDRMPRYVVPSPLAINKRIAERLALKVYDFELEMQSTTRIWAYRKASWSIDEWPESILNLYYERGEEGLAELPEIGSNLAKVIAAWITKMFPEKEPQANKL
jgi:DNA repair photolyase